MLVRWRKLVAFPRSGGVMLSLQVASVRPEAKHVKDTIGSDGNALGAVERERNWIRADAATALEFPERLTRCGVQREEVPGTTRLPAVANRDRVRRGPNGRNVWLPE
jgi:hypothetical protein